MTVMSKVLLLWLEGPMQSWGGQAELYERRTESFPTKSAVWGMIFAALGWFGERRRELALTQGLKMSVIAYQPLVKDPLEDFQTAGSHFDRKDAWEAQMIPRQKNGQLPISKVFGKIIIKQYLEDAKFAVLTEVPDEWGTALQEAVRHPAACVTLGRRACIPSFPPLVGLFDSQKAAAHALSRLLEQRAQFREPAEEFCTIIESSEEVADAVCLQDVPMSYGQGHEIGSRWVQVLRKAEAAKHRAEESF